ADPTENARNRAGARALSTSGVRNVYPRSNGKYRVIFGVNKKMVHFGTYSTLDEAAEVVREKRKELFGEFAGGERRSNQGTAGRRVSAQLTQSQSARRSPQRKWISVGARLLNHQRRSRSASSRPSATSRTCLPTGWTSSQTGPRWSKHATPTTYLCWPSSTARPTG